MNFGIRSEHQEILQRIFTKYLSTGSVIVYGSRAKGNFTDRSDIDLVIKGSSTTDVRIIEALKDEIDESDLPFLVDIHYYEDIKNPSLVDHIDRIGRVMFEIGVNYYETTEVTEVFTEDTEGK